MEKRLAQKMTRYLIINSIVPSFMEDVYIYGFELLFSSIISTVIILILGMLLNQIPATTVFLAVFVILRRSTGGYHAKTYLKCKLYTVSVYLAVMILSMYTAVPGWLLFPLELSGTAV